MSKSKEIKNRKLLNDFYDSLEGISYTNISSTVIEILSDRKYYYNIEHNIIFNSMIKEIISNFNDKGIAYAKIDLEDNDKIVSLLVRVNELGVIMAPIINLNTLEMHNTIDDLEIYLNNKFINKGRVLNKHPY